MGVIESVTQHYSCCNLACSQVNNLEATFHKGANTDSMSGPLPTRAQKHKLAKMTTTT